MKRYRSHKVVEAAVIESWYTDESGPPGTERRVAQLAGGERVEVPDDIGARGWPVLGEDYLVRYEGGYVSWSPKAAFEAGYSEIA